MKRKDDRFIVTYKKSGFSTTKQILVDRETGVNYFVYTYGYATSITPLLDENGKPVVTKEDND